MKNRINVVCMFFSILSFLCVHAGVPNTGLYLNNVPLVADSTAGKIYITLEPETADLLRGTLTWDKELIKSVSLNNENISDKTGNFIVNNWFSSENTLTVNTSKETRTWDVVFTTLPLVLIDITQEELYRLRKETGKEKKHPTFVTFIDARFRTGGKAMFASNAMMKIRGASSTFYPKKSLAIELVDSTGEECDVHLLGYRKDDDWILDAMYTDMSRMRNRLNTDLWNASEDLPYEKDNRYQANGTSGEYVEVFMAGKYHGFYCFTDKIDRKKLNLKKTREASGNQAEQRRGLLWKCTKLTSAVTLHYYSAYPTNDTLVWEKYWEQKYPDDRQDQAYFNPVANVIDTVGISASNEIFDNNWQKIFYPENIVDYVIFTQALQWMDNLQKNYYFSIRNITKDKRILLTPWDLDATIGRASGGDPIIDNPHWFAFGEKLGGTNYLIWRFKYRQPKGFPTMINNRWQYLKAHALSLDSIRARLENFASILNRSGAWKREKALWGDIMANTPEEEIEFMMNFLKMNYEVFDKEMASWEPDLYTEPAPKTEKALYLVAPDKEVTIKGSKVNIQGDIQKEAIDDIVSIDVKNNQMVVNRIDGKHTYNASQVKEIVANANGLYTAKNFIPETYKETLDFDTHYAHPGTDKNEAKVKADDFAVSRTIRIEFDTDTIRVIGNLNGLNIVRKGFDISIQSSIQGMHYILAGYTPSAHLTLLGSTQAKISFDGVNIANNSGTVIESKITAPILLHSNANTSSTISGIHSANDIVLTGEGELRIISKADKKTLLESEKSITIKGGIVNLFTSATEGKGISANENLTINGGNTNIITAGKGSVTENRIDNNSSYAIYAGKAMKVSAGSLYIKTLGENGGIGILSADKFEQSGGDVALACFNTPIYTEAGINITDGKLFTSSLAENGITSNGNIDISGGNVFTAGNITQGKAFNIAGKSLNLKGGTIVGIGSNSDVPTTNSSNQAYVIINNGKNLGKYVYINDKSGQVVCSFEVPAYATPSIICSHSSLKKGETYIITTSDGKDEEPTEVLRLTAK